MSQEQSIRLLSHRFTWKVEDYLTRVEPVAPEGFIYSPEFVVAVVAGDLRFTLKLYPNGYPASSSPDNVGLLLSNGGVDDVHVNYSLYLLDDGGGKRAKELIVQDRLLKAKCTWGYSNFYSKASFQSNVDKVRS